MPETSEANESSGIMMTSEVEALLDANDEAEQLKQPLAGAVVYISKVQNYYLVIFMQIFRIFRN